MPKPCYRPLAPFDEYDLYAKRHNPFMFFSEIIGDELTCAEHVVPGDQLSKDLAAGPLPQFVWIGPDLCQSAHDCGVKAAESWMTKALPPVIDALGTNGVLIVTVDEDNEYHDTIPMITLGPLARPGATIDNKVDHRALLATIEDVLGLPRLKTTKNVPTLRALLRP